MLQKRKMKSNESPLEYFYSMKEISQQSRIDEQALITYIIKGINDSTQNKTMLIGCTSIVEFKTKLRVYETYKREMKQSESFNRAPNASIEIGKRPQIHCYNCQQLGHKAYECKAKIKNPNPKNFNYPKVLKAPTTHTVQDLPPNPCKFCAQLGIMNAFHWGYSCINKPYRVETTPQPQPKQWQLLVSGCLKNQTFVHNKGKGINDNSSLFKKLLLNIDTGSTINIILAAMGKKLNVSVEEYNVVNVKQTKGILKLNQTCTFDLKVGSLVRSVRFFILNTDLPYALLGLESCIEFQLVIDCVKQVVVPKGRNLINFSSSECNDYISILKIRLSTVFLKLK
ncbi:uncharacterized protein TNCT_459821 [Trichonephila clavata]|uniref:CCHC-type domain-containing protein n=1 Tax=Trichonephila clavata TaxID=2740835 RepID=A0A8X6FA22_TRICU|nr:uncharacterized protein TNCT_459821 [Trichonephila clavata]